MNIVLMGYRGSGKTSIGKLLANQLWKTFVDIDREACRRFDDATIAEIWETRGEPAWREAEAAATRDVLAQENQVIAMGGGTPMIPAVRELLESAAACRRIYLRCDSQELHRRISQDAQSAATRPDLTGLGGGVEEIRAVLAEREPVYRALADAEFDVTRTGVEETVRHLIGRCL